MQKVSIRTEASIDSNFALLHWGSYSLTIDNYEINRIIVKLSLSVQHVRRNLNYPTQRSKGRPSYLKSLRCLFSSPKGLHDLDSKKRSHVKSGRKIHHREDCWKCRATIKSYVREHMSWLSIINDWRAHRACWLAWYKFEIDAMDHNFVTQTVLSRKTFRRHFH